MDTFFCQTGVWINHHIFPLPPSFLHSLLSRSPLTPPLAAHSHYASQYQVIVREAGTSDSQCRPHPPPHLRMVDSLSHSQFLSLLSPSLQTWRKSCKPFFEIPAILFGGHKILTKYFHRYVCNPHIELLQCLSFFPPSHLSLSLSLCRHGRGC